MTHRMKLVDFAFNAIKSGRKDIEVRLNDEKRQLISVNDIIEFTNVDTGEIVRTKVIGLHKFDSFSELFKLFPHYRLGLKDTDDESIMNNFYSLEEQEKYGALGIEIKLLDR